VATGGLSFRPLSCPLACAPIGINFIKSFGATQATTACSVLLMSIIARIQTEAAQRIVFVVVLSSVS
jgi:hypothetical protein